MPSVVGDIPGPAPGQGGTSEDTYSLPASWYRSEEIYQLERRAIFAKKWLFTTHKSRLSETGKYVLFTIAGYNFFLIKDRQGKINAFHNGEDHHLTEAGTAAVLACKYHGWSYKMSGELAKAPSFDKEPGFVPSENGLWDLRVHEDKLGFLWVNMDKSADAISWADQFGAFDEQERLKEVNMDDYVYDHSWEMKDCKYNWKVLNDNFNECYHCQSSHPGIAKSVDLMSYSVRCENNTIAHHALPKPGVKQGHRQGGHIIPIFMFPYAAYTITPIYAYSMRVVPTSATTTAMQYDVYRHKNADPSAWKETHEAFSQIEGEDKFLCTNVQKNIMAGTYSQGPLHSEREAGVIYFQQLVREALTAHREEEKAAGHKINPALVQQRGVTADDVFCSALEDCSDNGPLSW
ncbi:hypothetical protein MNV49_003255 [Pseudohyphozyma bogoriensis]|nr:hypothetical protein MNV49_003255 [Pseudohyphozyma bogoriensis]